MKSFTIFLALASAVSGMFVPGVVRTKNANRKNGDIRMDPKFDPHDETPGSGGDWTAIFDNDDPRSVDDIILDLGIDAKDVYHKYSNSQFKGFAATLSSHCVNIMSNATAVKRFEPEMEVVIQDVQVNAPWGLQRMSQGQELKDVADETDIAALNFRYSFEGDYTSIGKGVDIYIVDTGINVDHVDFEGRAKWGFTIDVKEDKDGHGTHCAGTAGGATFGIAKGANLIAVRVLGADGGSSGDIIAGLQYVIDTHDERKNQPDFRGSVISMSLGAAGRSEVIDEAVAAVNRAGVHISVAAGNDGADTCNSSPAGVAKDSDVVAVSATDINDQRPTFSNSGECTTVYAPGVDITSAFIGSPNEINVLQGTSMACPHVTGLIASYLGLDNSLATDPGKMKALLLETSQDIEVDVGTVKFVNNGFNGAEKRKRAVEFLRKFRFARD